MNKNYWKLTDEEYEFIKGEVIHIFELYNVKCIPVCGFEVASRMGITLIPYSSLSRKKRRQAYKASEDGFLYVDKDGNEYIYYNNIDRCYERQNWTILHEIGHIVLDHTGHSKHEEDEANFFAKYAIAPPLLIHKIGAKSPIEVYNRFDISLEAAEYAFDYYCNWKRRYERIKTLTSYERKLLSLYRKCA